MVAKVPSPPPPAQTATPPATEISVARTPEPAPSASTPSPAPSGSNGDAKTSDTNAAPIEPAKPIAKTGTKPRPGTKPTTTPKATKMPPVETKPIETKPAATKEIDPAALAAQYKQVGAQLKALDEAKGPDATSDLRSQYRLIRISEAMASQEKRDWAAALLTKLSSEIATRQKQPRPAAGIR